jgi:hypothetical protein
VSCGAALVGHCVQPHRSERQFGTPERRCRSCRRTLLGFKRKNFTSGGARLLGLIARFIISPMRNRTRESSISSLYPTSRDVNRFSSMLVSILLLLVFAEKSRSGLSGKQGLGHRPFSAFLGISDHHHHAAFDCLRADSAAAFASCSAPFTKRSLNFFV